MAIRARTIHIVVPWKAGGGTDSIGRAFAQALKEVSGQDVVVDDISGASGAIGTVKAAHAKPDGYTLLLNGDADMNSGLTFRKEPYDLSNFVYIAGVFESPTWMLANTKRGYADFAAFAKAAKAHPSQLTVGVGGATGAHMLMAAAIRGATGLKYRIIPYSGGAALKKALIGNQVDAGVIHAPVLLPEIKSGLINVLATGRSLSRVQYPPIREYQDTAATEHTGVVRHRPGADGAERNAEGGGRQAGGIVEEGGCHQRLSRLRQQVRHRAGYGCPVSKKPRTSTSSCALSRK